VTIGESLTTARSEAGVSVAEISERTRIRSQVIEAVERDEFAMCGGDFYARGHIRTLAAALGLDPQPLLAHYDQQRGTPPPTTLKELFGDRVGQVEPRTWNWSAVLAGLLVVAVAYGGYRLASATDQRTPQGLGSISVGPSAPTDSQSGPGQPSGTDRPGTGRPSGIRQPSGTVATYQDGKPGVAAGSDVVTGPTTSVRIRIFIHGAPSWLSATGTSGKQLFSGTLTDGEHKTFADPRAISLIIGNAGAVQLVVNGVDVGEVGTSGEVVRVTYRPGDPRNAR
jgi:cytoskeleton protein RodZ